MKWNEKAAIRFLQAALQTEPRAAEPLAGLPKGVTDAGWCCTEHALVASVAFACLGEPAMKCSGELRISDRQCRERLNVAPHEFVVIQRTGEMPLIFDSSVRWKNFSGVTTDYLDGLDQRLPDFTGPNKVIELPPKSDAERYIPEYRITSKEIPDNSWINRVSDNPIGRWILDRYGAQDWSKVVWEVITLLGSSEAPDDFGGRDLIWSQLHRLPSRRDEVSRLLKDAKK